MNKKRETIRKPIDREMVPDWDKDDRIAPPKPEPKKRKLHDEEEDMISDKEEY
ncbi:hypothetical protein [Sphaerochaeta sp. PS]|uniref:hypothetical protein n=1 Tax=Sphaerochaeta sp. PS TaxID=3076336 RepID=UPI0028A32408|nr:hypothetical protein [Sphaerochaeta sp. PS]MDT4762103.1 hypothetical protein [Sphaerochaeta sp. PS]